MDLCHVDAQHAIQPGPDLKFRSVRLLRFVPRLGKFTDIVPLVGLQGLERDLQLFIAFQDLGLLEVV